ncbi:conserved protein of unknown function [Shewanella benthica]|uniref:Uncharacterized protein n=2 Tax=Shewanella benthica TaxID=43661 RepID=A0A330M9H4_9GAMM|nr:hypothetical protein KT99_06332 [Shewanella benthica KT99]SQH78064.1 conserved protein of unknown function [Shewanella benthica]
MILPNNLSPETGPLDDFEISAGRSQDAAFGQQHKAELPNDVVTFLPRFPFRS